MFGRYAKIDGVVEDAEFLEIEPVGEPFECEYTLAASNTVNYGVYANYKILNGFEIKGTYNHQSYPGGSMVYGIYEDKSDPLSPVKTTITMNEGQKNADLWSVALEADQNLLKLFSLLLFL